MKKQTALALNISKTLAILTAIVFSIQFLFELNSLTHHSSSVRSMAKLARQEDNSRRYEASIFTEKKLDRLQYNFFWITSSLGLLALSPWAKVKR